MCGFSNCNPLDANSSFLIENKDDNVKRLGSLWLCQKPSFDVGYSVPIRRTGVSLTRQISTGGGKKTWTVENDDDDDDDDSNMVKTENLSDENDRKKLNANEDVSSPAQESKEKDDTQIKQNIKSSCGSVSVGCFYFIRND